MFATADTVPIQQIWHLLGIVVTDHTQILRCGVIEKLIDSQNVDPLIFIP